MSLDSAKEFVNKIRFMNELMESLQKADETEREKIISEAGYDFTFDELKQALSDYNDQLFTFVSGGAVSGSKPCGAYSCGGGGQFHNYGHTR